jgi:hypothetical protein
MKSKKMAWQTEIANSGILDRADLLELQDHLESEIQNLVELGLSEDEAQMVAEKRFGSADKICEEYAKVHPFRTWRIPLFWSFGSLFAYVILNVFTWLVSVSIGIFTIEAGASPLGFGTVEFVVRVGLVSGVVLTGVCLMKRYPVPKLSSKFYLGFVSVGLTVIYLALLLGTTLADSYNQVISSTAWSSVKYARYLAEITNVVLFLIIGGLIFLYYRRENRSHNLNSKIASQD